MGLITGTSGTALLAAQEDKNPDATQAASQGPAEETGLHDSPDMTNVVYGSDKKFNVIDLWKAKSDKPTPLVIFIHGGGFGGGSKDDIRTKLALDEYLKTGVSCASIVYRRLQSKPGPRQFIYPAIFLDCARAVQFFAHNAKEWNLDPTRFACAGGSAGAGMALWIGFHKDLADPRSDDPVARESTRLTCVAVFNAQTRVRPALAQGEPSGQSVTWCPTYGNWSASTVRRGVHLLKSSMRCSKPSRWRKQADGGLLAHKPSHCGGAAGLLHYLGQPLKPRKDESDDIHQIRFGLRLKEKMDALKVECEIVGGGPRTPRARDGTKRTSNSSCAISG